MIGERIFPELNDYIVTVTIVPRSTASAYFPCISRSSAAFRCYDRRAHITRTRQLSLRSKRTANLVQYRFRHHALPNTAATKATFAPRHPLCAVTSALLADAFAPLSSTMVRAMPLQNISFPYCRAKAFSRRPAMLHCNNSAVLLATALLYRLCQTAPIKPQSRFCQNRLVNAVCALPYARCLHSLLRFGSLGCSVETRLTCAIATRSMCSIITIKNASRRA